MNPLITATSAFSTAGNGYPGGCIGREDASFWVLFYRSGIYLREIDTSYTPVGDEILLSDQLGTSAECSFAELENGNFAVFFKTYDER